MKKELAKDENGMPVYQITDDTGTIVLGHSWDHQTAAMFAASDRLLHACQMAGRCEEGWLNACYEACKAAGAPLA